MTKEEQQFNQWFDWYADGVKVFEEADMKQAYLQGRADLEKENAELEQKLEQTEKDLADYQFNYPTIKELQKENADLKEEINKIAFARGNLEEENAELKEELKKWKDEWQEQVQKATDEGYARTLQTIQLSRAKELLKQWLQTSKASGCDNINIVSDTEQFLNSEVAK